MLPLTDYKNMGWPVLNLEKYLKDYPNSYDNLRIGYSQNYSFAYTNFYKYVEKSEVTKKVKGGFSLNFGVFSIGAKKSMERTFSKTTINESNRVFGELYYQYMDSRYWLKNTSDDIKIMKSYVSQSFTDDLYNITPGELFETYGGFVLCDFIVGGKVIALYSGVYQGNESSETRGKKMQTDIDASYGKIASGDFGIGRAYSNGNELSNKFTDLRTSVKTLGGIGAIATFTNPEKMSSINVNLTAWLNSLSDKNNHSVIDISDNGLLPITEFVREDNLRYPLKRMLNHGTIISEFKEPFLMYAYEDDIINKEIICLVTRFGDAIILYDKEYINKVNTKAIIDKYSSIYKIKVVDMSDYYYDMVGTVDDLFIAVSFMYEGFVPSYTVGERMKKFVHDNTTYLISQKTGVKFAYSIHDDYILDTYGIREWVNNMSTIQLTLRQLDDYIIVAL
ncbi:MAG: hypothetical protein COC06_09720 [Bacteroidales bacterium]|nr:MAG: hypothetical protein COC06_09720 [Bacteroidales bacterium]